MEKSLNVDQDTLVEAWQQQLPEMLGPGDSSVVQADLADPQSLLVHINVAGHQMYAFDFRCSYQDTRELEVTLVDAEKAGRSIDERGDAIQELAKDYARHIHECAQVLHSITNPS
ncbi:hypothetical protein [Paenibacillus caui]|uniref:hypothetical protein n=1 Tax=Paenibacillus caui TaxID=2873927 RepID=UPI001CA9327E|nr:hypothetical protein [Paenibacillus caui]